MYTFDQYFWIEITNTRQQNSRFFSSTSLAQFSVNCMCNDILLMNKTYWPSL